MAGLSLRRLWIPLLVLSAMIAIVVVRILQASAEREAAPTVETLRVEGGVPVTTSPTVEGPLEVWREFSGTVAGVREGVVRARTTDQISAVPVSVGQSVRQGQVLVRQAGETIQARLRQAETARQQAQRAVDRLRPLHEAGALSDQEWEDALTRLDLASADLSAAGEALSLTSPLSGVVTEVIARPGMVPSTGDPLVRVADLSQLVVFVRVSAAQAMEMRQGLPARVAETGVTGRVRRVALQADPATRLVEVEIEFPRGSGLIPGTLATAEVRVAARERAIHVPRAAVRDGRVWVVDENRRAVSREVTPGVTAGDRIEIASGLQPGDQVVVDGASLLSPDALVRVVGGEQGAPADAVP
jgi:membrane fusion protein, multidrug efflux system